MLKDALDAILTNQTNMFRRISQLEAAPGAAVVANAIATFAAMPGLRAFWPMSSVYTSAAALDIYGNANHLSNGNTAQFGYLGLVPYINMVGPPTNSYLWRADGGAGNWADILGTEGWVQTPARGLTMGGWFDFDSAATLEGLMSKWLAAGNQRSYHLWKRATEELRFEVSIDGTAVATVTSTPLVSTTGWYFVVGRFDPSSELAICINNQWTTVTAGVPASIFDSTTDFMIGRTDGGNNVDGRASMCFLSGMMVSNEIVENLYYSSRSLFVT